MGEKRPVARLDQGYVKIQLTEPPGCKARTEALLAGLFRALLLLVLGFVAGCVYWALWG